MFSLQVSQNAKLALELNFVLNDRTRSVQSTSDEAIASSDKFFPHGPERLARVPHTRNHEMTNCFFCEKNITFEWRKNMTFFPSFGETWTRFKVCTNGSFAAMPQNLLDWTVLPFSHYTIKAQRMQQVSLYIKLSRVRSNRTVLSLNLMKKIVICLFFYRKNQIIYRIIGFR